MTGMAMPMGVGPMSMAGGPMSIASGPMRMGIGSVPLMALMMLPSAMPAIAHCVRRHPGPFQAPLFATSYLGVWVVFSFAVFMAYRPVGTVTAGALIVAAGLYELSPLKRECRRRCREPLDSGLRFGAYCFGSSIGLMVVLIAIDPMSIALMCGVTAVVLFQKLYPYRMVVDLPLALTIVAIGLTTT